MSAEWREIDINDKQLYTEVSIRPTMYLSYYFKPSSLYICGCLQMATKDEQDTKEKCI